MSQVVVESVSRVSGGLRRALLALACVALPAVSILTGCSTARPKADPVYFPSDPAKARVLHVKSFNSLHDLVRVRVGFVDLVRGGAVNPYVESPAGVAYCDGKLYVCDTALGVVHVWDLNTGKARRFGGSGDVRLSTPMDVALDSRGAIYVADTGRSDVVAFAANGAVTRRFRPSGDAPWRPVAVAVDDATLYVADAVNHRVEFFAASDGSRAGSIGKTGRDAGEFYYPSGLAIGSVDAGDAGGWLYVAEMMNGRVQVFDAERRPLRTIGQPGDRYGDLGKPKHVGIGPDGVVLIADAEFAHVHLFDRTGRLLMVVGGPEDQPGGTPLPIGVASASALPDSIANLVPDNFSAEWFFFVTNGIGAKRISLFAVGRSKWHSSGTSAGHVFKANIETRRLPATMLNLVWCGRLRRFAGY